MGKKISKFSHISEIFWNDENGFYTKDALMYQDILRFSNDKTCFTRTGVDNWLLRHNQELINDYKDLSTRTIRYSTRRASKKDRLDRIFNNLLDMKVIVRSGTTQAMKIDIEIETYSIDKSGKLILEIIRNMNLKNKLLDAQKNEDLSLVQVKTKELENNYLNIYNLITSIFTISEEIPYRSIILKQFLVNLQNKKLFAKFVDHVSFVIHHNRINSIFHLISVVLNFMLNQASERNLFIDLFYESVHELDSEGKKIFLYGRKLDIEENIRNNSDGYSIEYEKHCFANRADYNKIVLEGECSGCKKPNVIIISHDEYKRYIQDIDAFGTKRGTRVQFDCKFCGSKESCSLLTF